MVKRGAGLAELEPRSHSLVVRATGNRVGPSLGSSNLSLGAKSSCLEPIAVDAKRLYRNAWWNGRRHRGLVV